MPQERKLYGKGMTFTLETIITKGPVSFTWSIICPYVGLDLVIL